MPRETDTKPESSQVERFKEAARELGCDKSEERFNAALKTVAKHKPGASPQAARELKVCPECSHVFQGNGWDGIDAHWKAKHAHIMPYAEAWPLIKGGTYKAAR